MCEFCENIARDNNEYFEKRVKGGDFIFQEDGELGILIDTGDSGCLGVLNNIVACPKCGRNLRLDRVAIGNAEELKKFGIELKNHNPIGLYRGITTKKENRREFNETYVEGDLIHSGGKVYIHPVHNRVKVENELGRIIVMHEVQPDTVAQI